MTKNKRYSLDFEEYDAIWIDDNIKNKSYTIRNDTIKEKELEKIVNLLNEQDQRITELEKCIEFARDIIELNCGMEQIDEFHKFKEKIEVVTDDC